MMLPVMLSPLFAQQPAPATQPTAQALATVPMNLQPLADAKPMLFMYYRTDSQGQMQPVGHIGMTQRRTDNGWVFEDFGGLDLAGGGILFRQITHIQPGDPLTVKRFFSQVIVNQQIEQTTATRQNRGYMLIERILADQPKNAQLESWPQQAMIDYMLFRLIPLLPRQAGLKWTTQSLIRAGGLDVARNITITSDGLQNLKINNQTHQWFCYRITGTAPGVTNYRFQIYVDQQGRLQCIDVIHLASRFLRIPENTFAKPAPTT